MGLRGDGQRHRKCSGDEEADDGTARGRQQGHDDDQPAQAIRDGITSLKVFMTYNQLKLDDYQLLDVMALAGEEGARVMMHAENHDMIRWVADRMLASGYTAPKYHTVAHDKLSEMEASCRAVVLNRLIDVPVIVHASGAETVETIRQARTNGAFIHTESCPQYLFLTTGDLDAKGMEGAKFCCSLPPRDASSQEPSGAA